MCRRRPLVRAERWTQQEEARLACPWPWVPFSEPAKEIANLLLTNTREFSDSADSYLQDMVTLQTRYVIT